MSDINKAQTAVAAYCEGDIGLGDRLVESAAAAQQGLEREDGTVLSRESRPSPCCGHGPSATLWTSWTAGSSPGKVPPTWWGPHS